MDSESSCKCNCTCDTGIAKSTKPVIQKSNISDDEFIPMPVWIRCTFCNSYAIDRFILDYGRYFLLPFGSISWIIYLIFT